MYVSVGFTGFDTFEKDFDELKTEEEKHLSASKISEELREKIECLSSEGETSYVYITSKYEFCFTMEDKGNGTSLSVRYGGYKER